MRLLARFSKSDVDVLLIFRLYNVKIIATLIAFFSFVVDIPSCTLPFYTL